MDTLSFRQIHLDFHTSELINQVGAKFNPIKFANTLVEANVDSITCFARCHHGMMYYDSKLFKERIHPNLVNKNLLQEQISACHDVGIKVPVYITVQWDYYTSIKHPEWIMRDSNGTPLGQHSLKPGFYHGLCVNTPYADFLKEHTKEVLNMLNPDGLFFDIVKEQPCACEYCIASMKEKGFDPLKVDQRLAHYKQVLDQFKLSMTKLVHSIKPGISIFYNSGHISHATKSSEKAYTHYELESLPGGEWGYIHFPVTSRYARKLGKEMLGHTGKFHTSWGDFHSFRNQGALEYECFRMLALNGKCLIGDQLEPNGQLSSEVYKLIGNVYGQVKDKQPWCTNAIPLTEIGVITSDEFSGSELDGLPSELIGVTRLLEQLSLQFDFIDTSMDFYEYKLLILPDTIPVEGEFLKKITTYLENGGKLLASFESGMDFLKEKFTIKELGVTLNNVTKNDYGKVVRGTFDTNNSFADYILPEGKLGENLPNIEHVMYTKGVEVKTTDEGETCCYTVKPYFHRSYKHFCSHRQAPSKGEIDYPAIVKGENSIYFSHPVFSTYAKLSPKWIKTLLKNAISELLGQQLVSHNGPSSIITTLNRLPKFDVLHVLWYIPEKKSEDLEIVEDVFPYYNLVMELITKKVITSVKMVPNNEHIPFTQVRNKLMFTIPKINGHCMVEIS